MQYTSDANILCLGNSSLEKSCVSGKCLGLKSATPLLSRSTTPQSYDNTIPLYIPAMPGRRTWAFRWPGRHLLAPSAKRRGVFGESVKGVAVVKKSTKNASILSVARTCNRSTHNKGRAAHSGWKGSRMKNVVHLSLHHSVFDPSMCSDTTNLFFNPFATWTGVCQSASTVPYSVHLVLPLTRWAKHGSAAEATFLKNKLLQYMNQHASFSPTENHGLFSEGALTLVILSFNPLGTSRYASEGEKMSKNYEDDYNIDPTKPVVVAYWKWIFLRHLFTHSDWPRRMF